MNETIKLLEKLEKTNGNIAKEMVLKEMVGKDSELYLRLALDPNIVLGVAEKTIQAVEADKVYSKTITREFDAMNFAYIVENCIKRSGNNLINFLCEVKSSFSELEWKWIKRLVLKDLKCNVGLKMVNKILPKPKIPKFEMQLCDTIDIYDKAEVEKKLEFPCAMECKYDGIRLQAEIFDDGVFQLLSRRGTDKTEDFKEIGEELVNLFPGQHLCFDGEIITSGKRSFQSIMKKDAAGLKRLFVVFDLLNDEHLPYISRYDNLTNLIENVTSDKIILAEHYSANNIEDVQKYYEDLNERGEEGIVLKLFNRIYERGSRKYMFKCKKVYTMDLECIGYEYGTIGTKREDKVSSLNLKNKDGSIIVSVGSGFSDTDIDYLTEHKDELVGRIVEIKYNEKTETGSIRFPRFVCFRDDKEEAD